MNDGRSLLAGPVTMLFDFSHLFTKFQYIIVTLLDPKLHHQPEGNQALPGASQSYGPTACGTIAKGAHQAFALRWKGDVQRGFGRRGSTVIEHWELNAPLHHHVGDISTEETSSS